MSAPVLGGLSREICKLGSLKPLPGSNKRNVVASARPKHSRDAGVASTKASTRPSAVAERATNSTRTEQRGLDIEVDNEADEFSTVISVTGLNRPGLLSELTQTIQKLKLDVVKVPSLAKQ